MENDQIQNVAKCLLSGLSEEEAKSFQVTRLSGGGNNRAYSVQTPSSLYFLKVYHKDPEDPRSRGKTEYQWLSTLSQSGVQDVSQVFGFFESMDCHAGLYEFIQGSPVRQEDLNESLVNQAAAFLKTINAQQVREKALIGKIPRAAEACFSLQEHWATVEKRVELLAKIDTNAGSIFKEAKEFVTEKLEPAWVRISKNKPLEFTRELTESERVLSPSDFGFHNAILNKDGHVRFIDFEYAGWDDPAKLVSDFFNQVAVPVPKDFSASFLNEVSKIVPNPEALSKRVEILYPIYKTKWICILLNHFLPADARRKKFALQNHSEWESVLHRQLLRATELLETLDTDVTFSKG